MRRAAVGLGLIVALVLPTLGAQLAPVQTAAAAPHLITMRHFSFCIENSCPATPVRTTLTIKAGETIQWVYRDANIADPPSCADFLGQCPGHSTTAVKTGPGGKPLWDSGVQNKDGYTFTYTFNTPGTYDYYCVIHGGANPNNPLTHMDGTIIVEGTTGSTEAATTTAPPAPPGLPSAGGGGG